MTPLGILSKNILVNAGLAITVTVATTKPINHKSSARQSHELVVQTAHRVLCIPSTAATSTDDMREALVTSLSASFVEARSVVGVVSPVPATGNFWSATNSRHGIFEGQLVIGLTVIDDAPHSRIGELSGELPTTSKLCPHSRAARCARCGAVMTLSMAESRGLCSICVLSRLFEPPLPICNLSNLFTRAPASRRRRSRSSSDKLCLCVTVEQVPPGDTRCLSEGLARRFKTFKRD